MTLISRSKKTIFTDAGKTKIYLQLLIYFG
jgi:hypothetical protein